jgi:hypothetical protein
MQRDQPAVINQQGIARQAHADKSILKVYHVDILMPCRCSEPIVDRSKGTDQWASFPVRFARMVENIIH